MQQTTIQLYDYFSRPYTGSGATLTAYSLGEDAELGKKVRPALIVVPGGGYGFLSARESEPVVLRFLAEGYAVFLLRYSVCTAYPVPLQEGAMAIAYVRENAAALGVDAGHVAAVGFSAGGHLVGMLATLYAQACVKEAVGERDVRLNAVLLAYPVITTGEKTHAGTAEIISGGDAARRQALSLETCVDKSSVPAFLWHTYEDDCVPVVNPLLFASAYCAAGVPFELHVFEKGAHGQSVLSGNTGGETLPPAVLRNRAWVPLALSWLKERDFVVHANLFAKPIAGGNDCLPPRGKVSSERCELDG